MVMRLVHPTDAQKAEKINAAMRSVGDAIRAARKQTGMSLIACAVRAGVGQGTVERIEAGENVTLRTVLAVAEVVGVVVEVRP